MTRTLNPNFGQLEVVAPAKVFSFALRRRFGDAGPNVGAGAPAGGGSGCLLSIFSAFSRSSDT